MINIQNTSVLFPGQGSQYIGMGKELYSTFEEAKEVFCIVNDILKQDLSKLMFEGDADELTATQNAQPAIMTVSIAALRVLLKQSAMTFDSLCSITAGHSLGEYSALCATGVFSLENTAALLRIRGNAMNAAASSVSGAMVALVGASYENAESIIAEASKFGICEIANDNGAEQIVLSGESQAMEKVIELASSFGIKRAIKLKVSAPFHSSLMTEAAIIMQKALDDIVISKPIVPIIANYTAKIISDSTHIKELLVKQIAGSVKWGQTMEVMLDLQKIENFIEIGPGQVLSNIAKRMSSNIKIFNIESPAGIENFLKHL